MSVANCLKRYRVTLVSAPFVLFCITVYFFNVIFIYIYLGQAGVLFKAFFDESVEATVYKEGLYVVAPWNKVYVCDTTQQKKTVDVDVLTNKASMRVSSLPPYWYSMQKRRATSGGARITARHAPDRSHAGMCA